MNSISPLLLMLQQQQEHLTVLLSLLNTERDALSKNDAALLESNCAEKIHCLEKIQQLDNQIAQAAELPLVKSETWFIAAVEKTDTVLAECKALSTINQQILEQSQLRVDALKHQLLQSSGKSGLTYNAKGKPALDAIGKGIKA